MAPVSDTAGATRERPISALWLYDELMKNIEPDLVSGRIETLEEKYAGESDEDRTYRLEKYALAFRIFDECLEELDEMAQIDIETWKEHMGAFVLLDAVDSGDIAQPETLPDDSTDA